MYVYQSRPEDVETCLVDYQSGKQSGQWPARESHLTAIHAGEARDVLTSDSQGSREMLLGEVKVAYRYSRCSEESEWCCKNPE
jgi:hypothetical protein